MTKLNSLQTSPRHNSDFKSLSKEKLISLDLSWIDSFYKKREEDRLAENLASERISEDSILEDKYLEAKKYEFPNLPPEHRYFINQHSTEYETFDKIIQT